MLPFTRPARTSNTSSATASPNRGGSGGGGGQNKLKAFFSGGGDSISTAAGAPGLVPGKTMAPTLLPTVQGGHVLVGAPTGAWQLILITRGKACPVSRNYLAAVEGAVGDLDALGVEVLAITADPRDRAEGFVEEVKAVSSGGGGGGGGGGGPGEVGFKMAYGLSPGQAGAWGFYLSEGPCPPGGGGVWGGAGGGAYPAAPAIHPEPGLILLTPDGEVSLVFKSSSAFGWADLRILVEGIRFMQEKGYPIRGTYGLE